MMRANKIGNWGGKMTQGLAIAIKIGVTKKRILIIQLPFTQRSKRVCNYV